MRRWAAPISGSWLAVMLMAWISPGCADNESSIFVRQVMQLSAPACKTTGDPTAPSLLYGVLDVGAAKQAGYQATLLVGNHLVPRGSQQQIRTETARVNLRGAVVRIEDANGNTLQNYTLDATGFVDPGTDTQPGWGLLSTTLIPPGTPALNWVTVRVKVFGQTLGGKDVESDELTFPINLCYGCLVDYPDAANTITDGTGYECGSTTQAQSLTEPCIIGQDDRVPCPFCVSYLEYCRYRH